MSPEEVQPFDLHRMLLGDMPWLFTLEIIVRTVVVYLFTVMLVRLISKRAVGQLSLVEFLLVIALGSAVGDPMFYPDVPLLHAMAVITVVVLLNRGFLYAINSDERIEQAIEGMPVLLVRDGIVQVDQLHTAMLSQEKLFEKLRVARIEHLGQVAWAFLEQGGEITVFRARPEVPGLSVVPPWDLVEPKRWPQGTRAGADIPQALGCEMCGTTLAVTPGMVLPKCAGCGNERWADAVVFAHEDGTDGPLVGQLKQGLATNGNQATR